jgi:hypothetical protein
MYVQQAQSSDVTCHCGLIQQCCILYRVCVVNRHAVHQGRAWQPFILPKTDLAQVDWRACPATWVEPLQPLAASQEAEFPWNWEWNFRWLNIRNWRYLDYLEGWRKLALQGYQSEVVSLPGVTLSTTEAITGPFVRDAE